MKSESPEVAYESEPAKVSITMDQIRDYQFRVTFDQKPYPDLMMDEPPPVGGDTAPSPSHLLAAAVGNCLSASFVFSARKVRADLESLHATVKVWYVRNEHGRMRIGKMKVEIEPKFNAAEAAKIERCLAMFEDYCVVTQSVRQGVEVSVAVKSK
jgi:uncharacterized OsmC-like protein